MAATYQEGVYNHQEPNDADDQKRLREWTEKIDAWRRAKGAWMTADQQYDVAMEMVREGKSIPPGDTRRVAATLRARLLDEAFEWLKQLCMDPIAPYSPALLFLGDQYAADRRWAEAQKLYALGADLCNDRECCLRAAEIFDKGPGGLRKDKRRAVDLREKATHLLISHHRKPPPLPAKESFSDSQFAASVAAATSSPRNSLPSSRTQSPRPTGGRPLPAEPLTIEAAKNGEDSMEALSVENSAILPGAFPTSPFREAIVSPIPSPARTATDLEELTAKVEALARQQFSGSNDDVPYNEPVLAQERQQTDQWKPSPPTRKTSPSKPNSTFASRAASVAASNVASASTSPSLGPSAAPPLPPRSGSALSLSRSSSPLPEAQKANSMPPPAPKTVATSLPQPATGNEKRIQWAPDQFKELDGYIRHLPVPTGLAVDVFCKRYLLRTCKTQLDVLRAIFVWITETVAWDDPLSRTQRSLAGRTISRTNSAASVASVENFKSPEDLQEIMSALRTREQGFANLFLEMCRAAQIPAFKVEGYLKGSPQSAQWSTLPDQPNHAWNVVNLDGVAYIVDCALANPGHPWNIANRPAPSESKGSKTEVKFPGNTYYFLMSPTRAIYTHFPKDSKYQFLTRIMTTDEFISQPCYRPSCFEQGIRVDLACQRIILVEGDEVHTFKLGLREGTIVRAELIMDSYEGERETKFSTLRKTSVEVVNINSSAGASPASSFFGGSSSSLNSATVVEVRPKRLAMAQIVYEKPAPDAKPERMAAIMIKIANRLGPRTLEGTLKIFAGSRTQFDRSNVEQMPLALIYRVNHTAADEISSSIPVSLQPMQFEFLANPPSEPEMVLMDPYAYALQQNDIVTFRCRLSNPWGEHASLPVKMTVDHEGRKIAEGPVKVVLLTPKEERVLPYDVGFATWSVTVKAREKGAYMLSVYTTPKLLQSFASWKIV